MKELRMLLILVLSISLCGCYHAGEHSNYVIIEESQNSLRYITSLYNYEELHNILSAQPSIGELQKSIHIDFMKITKVGYETLFQTDKGLILVVFASNKRYSYRKDIHLAKDVPPVVFDNIALGTPLSKIQQIDPLGDYSFLDAGSSEVPSISNHYLESGEHYTIYYDKTLCVISIEKSLI